ncbi:M48 family metallopeptidase [Chryseobacterium oncorhynchi]|uniref:M48 family peptidase n=1 Tax=Chryseobacterium oncorhynchi TaxID=741074 RepID=A0A316X1M7_9FLAO|nr:SprT family zinc-dependent metalloprotease [Chryseobacterium oncorhynchi]PWN67437.1 M48 family peptidase [Chryseobacterium oncorhynchi]
MYSVQYGNKTIEYSIMEKDGLKSHYISVEKDVGVILKGKAISIEQANKLILRKAKWILDKLELVSSLNDGEIVTGSRIQYLGRKYYVEIIIENHSHKIEIDFTESKFKITLPDHLNTQENLRKAVENYYRLKAQEKIEPILRKKSKTIGLQYDNVKFMKLEKRWGSCTPSNTIIINFHAIKLPFSLIEYLVVHELVHTKVKSHSKEFWAELSKHIFNWKELDAKMYEMKL